MNDPSQLSLADSSARQAAAAGRPHWLCVLHHIPSAAHLRPGPEI